MSNQTPDNSIYNNITEICKNVFMQTSGTRPPENVLKHLRSKCYEILLKKSCYKYPDPPDINMSLLKKCFIMKSDMQTICDMDRTNRLEKCTHKIMNEKIYKEEVFQKILSLLVCLADSLQYMEPLNLVPWTFGKRDEFCLIKSRADVGDSSLYPMYNIGMFSLNDDLDKEYYKDPFRRLQEAECRGQSVNPYFPHFGTELLKLEPGSGLPLLGQFLPQTKNSLLSSSKLNSSYSGKFFDLNKNIIANDESMDCLCIQEKISNSGSSSDHHVTFCTSNEGIVVEPASSGQITSRGSFRSGTGSGVSIRTLTDQEDDALELWSKLEVSDRANKHRNWSHLGDVNPPKEPEFATEADSALLFWTICNPTMNYINLDTSDFIRDVKHLLAGISSRTFLYNNNIDSFELIENVALPQKSPSCAEGYSESFICAGNWIMRLTKMFGGYKENKGFVYEALRKIVCDYLFSYQQIIFNISCTSVIELFQETLDLRTQIEILGHLFTEFEKDFPQGSQLLTMILSKTNDVVNRDVELILFAIIRECCTVYFRIIQQWLFTGILYDPYCELFIVKHDVSGGSRLHWNTCYTIVDKDTPAFLKSISSEILNCGKNLQLLRDCDPTHPLVTSLPEIAPYIPCCMSLEDVAELNNVCNKYNDKAVKMCGKLITIQVHLENEKLKRVENIAIAQRKRIENYEKWKGKSLFL
ncbi:uncharacterized protein LOC113384791 isoform X2 [Ctenocephalides felis]|uniref:uncharacterized protein LOC113384791 isoform X2 n=1 Tax=Ctenocephalides felis TaxID=7515 RepID=UPI000E6E5164|nr:uncharacterized protein LOC113384791 isoform X2 [Ctenocephalides felis]